MSLSLLPASFAGAAITPSWRINPISQAAIDDSGALLEHALSVSLMIELTGDSQFGVVGICLDHAYEATHGVRPSPLRFYQRIGDGASNSDRPPAANFPAHPALEFDTYVATASLAPGEEAAVPANFCGLGTATARIGNVSMQPTTGSNRVGRVLDVAWGASPSNGMNGTYEVARLTFVAGQEFETSFLPLPFEDAKIREGNPAAPILGLPPIPIPLVPEPTIGFGILILSVFRTPRK